MNTNKSPREEIIKMIQDKITLFFGVSWKELHSTIRERRIADARSAYINVLYNSAIMNGVQISEHLNITTASVYYHLRRCDTMVSIGAFGPLFERFKDEVKNDIMLWQKKKLSV